MKHRDLIKQLKDAGYHIDREDGDHTVMEKPGCRPVQIPRHKEVNEITAKSILKTAGLK